MHVLAFLCALLVAAPFWEAKPAHDWSDAEISAMLHGSPWAQPATTEGIVSQADVPTWLSSAQPVADAEAEALRRLIFRKHLESQAEIDEYHAYLNDQKEKPIVLTVNLPDPLALANAAESKRMEEGCYLKIGRKKYKMTGHFPPTPDDPYLRLIFPRALGPKDKSLEFDLYLPGVTNPYRMVEYQLKDMLYKGKLEL
jgi:hypothetical protein